LSKLAENNELARLHPDVCRNTDATRNGPACTRAERPGTTYRIHVYGTCAFQRRRINSTVSHRHPYEIRTLHRLSDLFCQRKRFRVPARNKRSPRLPCSLAIPPSSSPRFSHSPSSSSQIRGWVRVIITSAESTTTTPSNVFSFSSYSPLSVLCFAQHRVGLIISFSAEFRNRGEKEDEDRKVAVGLEDPEGAFLSSFSGALMRVSFSHDADRFKLSTFCFTPLLIAIPLSSRS